MKPLALVSTVVPPIVVVFRAVPVAAGGVRAGCGHRDPEQHQRRYRQGGGDHCGRPGGRRGDPGRECSPGPAAVRRAVRRGGSKRKRGQDCEGGHLHDAGDDAGGRADLGEPEQPDPDRQEVPAEGGEGEAGSGRGGQPAGEDEPARDGQHRQPQAEGGDHLEQEQPADRGDRPVAGQVQVEMDRRGGDQQARTCHTQGDSGPAVRRRFSVPGRGWPRRLCRSWPDHAFPLGHLSVLRVALVRSGSVASAAGSPMRSRRPVRSRTW